MQYYHALRDRKANSGTTTLQGHVSVPVAARRPGRRYEPRSATRLPPRGSSVDASSLPTKTRRGHAPGASPASVRAPLAIRGGRNFSGLGIAGRRDFSGLGIPGGRGLSGLGIAGRRDLSGLGIVPERESAPCYWRSGCPADGLAMSRTSGLRPSPDADRHNGSPRAARDGKRERSVFASCGSEPVAGRESVRRRASSRRLTRPPLRLMEAIRPRSQARPDPRRNVCEVCALNIEASCRPVTPRLRLRNCYRSRPLARPV